MAGIVALGCDVLVYPAGDWPASSVPEPAERSGGGADFLHGDDGVEELIPTVVPIRNAAAGVVAARDVGVFDTHDGGVVGLLRLPGKSKGWCDTEGGVEDHVSDVARSYHP